MNINIDLTNLHSVINDSFYPLLTDRNRYLVLKGGGGSGKSILIAQKILLRILSGFAKGIKHNILCLRKTSPATRKSIFPTIRKYINEWGLSNLVSINKTEMLFTFFNGSQIMCSGLDDPEKIKSISDVTSVWLEEASEFRVSDFRQIDLRLRGVTKDYYQIMLSFNPISKNSWIYEIFFNPTRNEKYKKTRNKTTIHESTYKDNRFLDDEYIDNLKGLENEDRAYYNIYTLGKWGVLENVIFNNWEIIDNWPDDVSETVFGVDFGWNRTAIVKTGINDRGLFLDEIFYEEKATNADLIDFLIKNVGKEKRIYGDSAEPDRIEEANRAELDMMPAKKGKNSVNDSIDFMNRHTMYITKSSINLIKELEGYKRKEDRDGNVLDEPVKFMDHAIDASRYGIYTHWGIPRPELKIYGPSDFFDI